MCDTFQWCDAGEYRSVCSSLLISYGLTLINTCMKVLLSRTDNQRMTVDRKFTFFTVRHEIHSLFRLHSLVNQYMRTESCTAGHRACVLH